MRASCENRFEPDYAIHPGEILEETLAARGIKKAELAERCQISTKHLSQIINGKAPVTADTAIQLERALGVSANIWNNLESQYRLFQARQQERERLSQGQEWLKRFPVAELAKRGYIESSSDYIETLKNLLQFLGVSSTEAFERQSSRVAVLYRRAAAYESSTESIAAWLRIGELEAESIETDPYDVQVFRRNLSTIRALTREDPQSFEPKMKELCRNAGVALVFARELPKTRLSGATRWLSSQKALIMLSLRYRWDDHFWFTFFHESAHILLHPKKKIFIEETRSVSEPLEDEANEFAANFLVPEGEYLTLARGVGLSRPRIESFAAGQGVAASVVVGRLQHDKVIGFNTYNDLRRRFQLDE